MKNIIIRTNRANFEAWGSIAEISRVYDLPYHQIARKKFPFRFRGWDYIKVRFREKSEN